MTEDLDLLDFDLGFLKDAAALVDASLELLRKEAEESSDPDGFGILDQIEYITGFGFVACQTYATSVVSGSNLKKPRALALGPKHRTGRYIAELVNASANHWKHSAEWSLDAPTKQTKQALEVISSLGVDTIGSYPVTNAFYEILEPLPARFATIIPFMTEWRDALLK